MASSSAIICQLPIVNYAQRGPIRQLSSAQANTATSHHNPSSLSPSCLLLRLCSYMCALTDLEGATAPPAWGAASRQSGPAPATISRPRQIKRKEKGQRDKKGLEGSGPFPFAPFSFPPSLGLTNPRPPAASLRFVKRNQGQRGPAFSSYAARFTNLAPDGFPVSLAPP